MLNNNFNAGFGGYPQGGMQYAARPSAKMTQPLTPEQIKKLKGNTGAFDLHIRQEEAWKALCTHKENGAIVLNDNGDGTVTCPICGETFTLAYYEKDQVDEAVRLIKDILQTVKTMYLDIPEEMSTQYFQILPLIDRLPQLYEIAKRNFNQYDQNNPVTAVGSQYGFNALNAFTSPGFGMMQPGTPMMGSGNPYTAAGYGNPAMQPNYVPAPQPVYGSPNPFGYGDPNTCVPQQQSAPQPAPQAQPAPATPAQNSAAPATDVQSQKVFNV